MSTAVRYGVRADGVATITLDQPDAQRVVRQLLDAARGVHPAPAAAGAVRRRRASPLAQDRVLGRREPGQVRRRRATDPQAPGHERFPRLFRLIGELGKPSLCAANGHVLAGALGLALACDLIVAREGARFGTPEINVGVFPFMIMALIYRNLGRKKTNELLLLGDRIDAREAERIGIVNRWWWPRRPTPRSADWACLAGVKSPR
jgi:enoyl-CoA hydratase/carnithine racemase